MTSTASETPSAPAAPVTTCARCGNHYTTEKSYQIHLHRKTPCVPVGEPRWRCTACDVIFESGDAKYSHCRSQKHKRAVDREQATARGTPIPPEDLSGCEVCEIESFRSETARTSHFKSSKHVAAVHQKEELERREARVAAGEDPEVPGCDVCGCATFLSARARASHLLTKSHQAAVKRQEKRLLEEVEGCNACDIERFRSEGVRAAHLLTKSHLDAADRAERREQRRLGHRVQGRAHAARAAREERPMILRMEDYAAVGTEGSDRPQLHRVGRAFPRRQVPVSTPSPSEPISETPQGSPQSPTALTLEAAPPTTSSSDVPRQTTPVTDPQLGDPVPEAPTDGFTGQVASDAAPTLVIESAPGPIDTSMIVAETAARSMDRAGEVDGYSDAPQDDFVTYLLSRFSEPQKRMFAESYGVYMREDMRNKFCIDLDLAFKWLGFTRKDSAVKLMQKHLIEGQDFAFQRAAECANWSQNGRIADKYMLTPRGFKKLLMRARTEQGDAATDYFLEIEDALLAYNTLKRTHTGVSQFDSSARARRNGLRLRSVTDSINTHVSGLYFGVPERTWAMLKPLNPSYSPSLLAVERAEMTVIKFGMKRGDTDRTDQHCTAFQGFYLLDHVPTEHMAEVEDLLKAWLRNEGLLFEGVHENRKARDTELTVVVTQADYARVVERTLLLIKQVDDKKRRLLGVGECAREEEARAEQEKAKAVQMALAVRMAEIELEKMRLSVRNSAFSSPEAPIDLRVVEKRTGSE